MFEIVNRGTDGAQMPTRVPSYKLTQSLRMGSGELKKLLEDKNHERFPNMQSINSDPSVHLAMYSVK